MIPGSEGASPCRFPALPTSSFCLLVCSEGLNRLILRQTEAIIVLGGGSIVVFRLLPTLAGLRPEEWSLASLRPMMIKTIQFHRQFGRAERNGHVDFIGRPGTLAGCIQPDLTGFHPGFSATRLESGDEKAK